MSNSHSITILVADDDPDDRMLIADAFLESKLNNDLRFVKDGVELMDYLQQKGDFTDSSTAPRPGLILLDLNMPRMDGREVLAAVKRLPEHRQIPIVVLTTSKAEEDILRTYELGVSSFITKPVSFEGLVEVVRILNAYWFQIVHLPVPEHEMI